MYIQVTDSIFKDELKAIRPNQFSDEGLGLLFDYLTESEDNGTEQQIELDVIGICCDFTESTIEDFKSEYRYLFTEFEDYQIKQLIEEYIGYRSIFVGWSGSDSFIYANF